MKKFGFAERHKAITTSLLLRFMIGKHFDHCYLHIVSATTVCLNKRFVPIANAKQSQETEEAV